MPYASCRETSRSPGHAPLWLPLALALALALGGSPLRAEGQMMSGSTMVLDGMNLSVSGDEMAALHDLASSLTATQREQDKALSDARRTVHSRDAKYVFAIYELEIGRRRKDDTIRAEALDALIASDLTRSEKLAGFLEVRGGIAFQQHDFNRAGALWSRLLTLRPNDPNTLGNLAQVHAAQGDAAGAADLLRRAAELGAASGKKASESLYRQRVSLTYNGRLATPGFTAALALIAAYPTQENWRYGLVAYRQLVAPKDEFEIDLLRLMRFSNSLTRPDEYQRMAQLLEHSGRPTEGLAVLDEAISRHILNAGESPTREIAAEIGRFIPQERAAVDAAARHGFTASSPVQTLALADSLVALGRRDEGVALYRLLLARPDADTAQVSDHLAVALLAAGRAAEAEAAFRSAAAGAGAGGSRAADRPAPYAELAAFWLARLSQPGSASAGPAMLTR